MSIAKTSDMGTDFAILMEILHFLVEAECRAYFEADFEAEARKREHLLPVPEFENWKDNQRDKYSGHRRGFIKKFRK